jgi:hypothetical protein
MELTEARSKAAKENLVGAIRAMQLIAHYFKHLKAVNYYPHEGQADPLRRILDPENPMRKVFLQCGRNFGKSTLGGIAAVAMAGLYPRQKVYIIGPYFNLTSEIYIQSYFLHDIIPPDWLESYSKAEYRFSFKNESFVKIDGADNEARVRGYKPKGLLVCDEFQDWKKEVWDAMEPNLLAHNALALLLGTPPDTEGVYTEQAEEVKSEQRRGDKAYLWMKRTTWDNPRFPREELERRRDKLIARGEERIWRREYEAEFVPGGARAVYPMFSKILHVQPPDFFKEVIQKQAHLLEGYIIYDPGGNRWGCTVHLYNRYTSKAYTVAEIVETDAMFLSCSKLNPRVEELRNLWFYKHGIEFTEVYDEAAKLFCVEMEQLGVTLVPTQKKQNDKSNNISLVRDMLSYQNLFINAECENTIWEFQNYVYTDRGLINKNLDELMDCHLYFSAESGYDLAEARQESDVKEADTRRGFSLEEDLANESMIPDLTEVSSDMLDMDDMILDWTV